VDSSRVAVIGLSAALVLGLGLLARSLWSSDPSNAASQTPLQTNLASVGLSVPLHADASVSRADVEEGRLVHMLVDIGDARMRIRVTHDLSSDRAEQRIDQDRQRIDALFGERQAPYPGELSHSLKCPEAFKPADHADKGSARTMVRLFANERLAYGGCSDDLLAYRATIGTWYDAPAERLVQVTYYTPRTDMIDAGPALLAETRVGKTP